MMIFIAIAVALMGLIAILFMAMMGHPIIAGLLAIVLAAFEYILFLQKGKIDEQDSYKKLQNIDHKHGFAQHIRILKDCCDSVEKKREFFMENSDEGDGVRESFNIISDKIYQNAGKAALYLENYDRSADSNSYMNNLVNSSEAMRNSLSELYELVLQMNDSTSDVDASFVDDMLKSLKNVL